MLRDSMKKIAASVLAIALAMLAMAKGSNNTRVAQNLNIFNSIYKELQTSYVDSIDADKAIRNAIDYMLQQIDPYTVYYPIQEQDALMQMQSGEFSGIGCTIIQRDGRVVLSDPTWGSPSRLAGVKAGDILLAIDGDTLPMGYTSTEATKRLRGQAGTKLKITVERPYAADSIVDIEITRGTIRTNPVPYYGMLGDSLGYIRLTTFNEKSADQVREAVLELKKNPSIKGLMIDLRDNGGGLLESAVQIAGFFVPKGTTVVTTKYRDKGNEKVYKTTQKPLDANIPLAFLVNDGTASASEILAGAMQDLDRAVIVGERSYGKGLVQTSRPLPYEGLLKITVARYYIPSGRLVQAIDYSHRNPDGSVARIPDSLTTVFHTLAGREVRDGGGIAPDVKVKRPEMNRLIYNVYSDLWAFDYATRFAARQTRPMPDAADFEVTDSIFDDFKRFIDPDKFQYDRLSDTGIKVLREAAEAEGYMTDSVAALFDALEAQMKHDLGHDLDFNRKELEQIIDDEISARYYDEHDRIGRQLKGDPDIEAATKALQPAEYRRILGKEK